MSNGNQQNNNQQQGQQKSGLSWNDPKNMNSPRPSTGGSSNNNSSQAPQGGSGRLVAMFVAGVILCALIVWGIAALRAENRDLTTGTSTSTTPGLVSTSTSATTSATVTPTPTTPVVTTVEPATTPTAVSPSGITSPVAGTPGTFTTADQAAGSVVKVGSVSVAEPMWFVVYDDVSGQPGRILGAGMVFPGQATVDVPVQRATVAGQSYRVGLSKTDNGSHEYSTSLPKLDQWSTFKAI